MTVNICPQCGASRDGTSCRFCGTSDIEEKSGLAGMINAKNVNINGDVVGRDKIVNVKETPITHILKVVESTRTIRTKINESGWNTEESHLLSARLDATLNAILLLANKGASVELLDVLAKEIKNLLKASSPVQAYEFCELLMDSFRGNNG